MVSEIVKNIVPSVTCGLETVVADLEAAGVDVIGLNAGEPDFDTPQNIVESCCKALTEGKTRYVNVAGIKVLREAICAKLLRENGVSYDAEQITVSTGAKQALNNAIFAICNPGDEIIIPIPGWVSYEEIARLAKAVPVCVETKPDYQLDVEKIKEAVTDKTKVLVINTPNNPTGAVYNEGDLRALGELAAERDFYIITDEVYEKFVYNGSRHICMAALSREIYNHTIVISGLSKEYAMTGWRCGYSAAPKAIAQGISALQSHTTSNSTTFVQWAAVEALQNGDESVKIMIREFEKRKNYLYDRICAIKGIVCNNVSGAFYLLPDVSYYYDKYWQGKPIGTSVEFCNYLLETVNVAVIPGEAFHAPDTIRIAYTNSMDKIREGVDRIERALKELDECRQ